MGWFTPKVEKELNKGVEMFGRDVVLESLYGVPRPPSEAVALPAATEVAESMELVGTTITGSTRALLERHEGFRRKPYNDHLGNLTIGHGINLANGLDDVELEFLFSHRLGIAEAGAARVFDSFLTLDSVRQAVLVDMCYQLGASGLSQFVNTIEAVNNSNYDLAAEEILLSKAAVQCPTRYQELSQMMRTGEWI